MSRIGLSPVTIPSGVEYKVANDVIVVKGKLGELNVPLLENISIEGDDKEVSFVPSNNMKTTRQAWGCNRALFQNAVIGVTEGYSKKIEMNGVGYRASVQGNVLKLILGFSHDVLYTFPADIAIVVTDNIIAISGMSKQRVGQVAAEIRSYRPPEPYLGKGLKYVGERIVRKEGKKK